MQIGHVTTPFGSRSMTLAMLASQVIAPEDGKSADKWELYRAVCEARIRLGVTDRALALLNALLTFYPRSELSAEHGMVVFPSNAQLSTRAHGMAEQTIRRHLSVLVEAGLIARKDSANGKRFARRDRAGVIDEAFGFSLAPLLVRAEEIEAIASDVIAERLVFQRLKERFTICRRDVAKLIAAALEEGGDGDWEAYQAQHRGIIEALSRKPSALQLAASLDEMELLRDGIVNLLEMQLKTPVQSGNDLQNERHIQNSNSESIIELEPRFEKKQGKTIGPSQQPSDRVEDRRERVRGEEPEVAIEQGRAKRGELKPGEVRVGTGKGAAARGEGDPTAGIRPFPLGMVLRACPQISDYGPASGIASWRDLMATAVLVRSMLGVSPSAYQDACAVMGPENAAAVIACILEKAGHISSAGGYLRDLTRRAEKGEFSLGPMLMALLKVNGGAAARVG